MSGKSKEEQKKWEGFLEEFNRKNYAGIVEQSLKLARSCERVIAVRNNRIVPLIRYIVEHDEVESWNKMMADPYLCKVIDMFEMMRLILIEYRAYNVLEAAMKFYTVTTMRQRENILSYATSQNCYNTMTTVLKWLDPTGMSWSGVRYSDVYDVVVEDCLNGQYKEYPTHVSLHATLSHYSHISHTFKDVNKVFTNRYPLLFLHCCANGSYTLMELIMPQFRELHVDTQFLCIYLILRNARDYNIESYNDVLKLILDNCHARYFDNRYICNTRMYAEALFKLHETRDEETKQYTQLSDQLVGVIQQYEEEHDVVRRVRNNDNPYHNARMSREYNPSKCKLKYMCYEKTHEKCLCMICACITVHVILSCRHSFCKQCVCMMASLDRPDCIICGTPISCTKIVSDEEQPIL